MKLRKSCGKLRKMLKVAGSCGKWQKLRKVAGNGKRCGTATTATKLCPWLTGKYLVSSGHVLIHSSFLTLTF